MVLLWVICFVALSSTIDGEVPDDVVTTSEPSTWSLFQENYNCAGSSSSTALATSNQATIEECRSQCESFRYMGYWDNTMCRCYNNCSNGGNTLEGWDNTVEENTIYDSSTLQCGSSVSGSTRGRSSQVGHRSGEVTYEFTAESSTSVTFDLCDSEYDTFLRIFDDSGDEIARNDDHRGRCGSSRNRLASHVETTVQAGRTYTVVVEGFRNAEGNFQLDVTCGNDGGDQVDTIACGQTVSGTTVGRPSIVGNNAGEAIFEFVSTQRNYQFDACLSTYDSVIRVYEGAAADLSRSSRQIAMNDDHGGRCSGSNRFASHIRRARTRIGQTYTLVVEGYKRNEGNFVVTANC